MKIVTEVELQPFNTPNYVIQKTAPSQRQDGIRDEPKYALAELHPEVLDQLCNAFRAEIFAKAGKKDPRP